VIVRGRELQSLLRGWNSPSINESEDLVVLVLCLVECYYHGCIGRFEKAGVCLHEAFEPVACVQNVGIVTIIVNVWSVKHVLRDSITFDITR